jgi:hypothetical protein
MACASGCAALIPYARNARTHSDQQVAQIAASIREFGFTNPVLIDEEDGNVIPFGDVFARPGPMRRSGGLGGRGARTALVCPLHP